MNRVPLSPAALCALWIGPVLALGALLGFGGVFASDAVSDPDADPDEYEPRISAASEEPSRAIAGFRLPEGSSIRPWAAEPLLANPVAFAVDDEGRVYVAETFRLHEGVTDTRGHMYWLDDDLACETVEDRIAMYRKHFDEETFKSYGRATDRLRLVVDSNGDGKADSSTVFADGFDDVLAGIGAGVLARDGNVWYSCIPDLWKLRDTTGNGEADERDSLHYGYGVHVGFLGHDLHGLIFGPDGKLYFTIGDRGLNVETKEGTRLAVPHTGALLRCNPDGTELEVLATGLRNPQELAFDRYGNLFTVDNNSDAGDQCRLIDLVEGGDSGWQMGWQYLTEPNARGPWNSENLWKPEEQGNDAAYQLPPLANFSDGPSGFVYNPGVAGMPSQYDNAFFLADFRGTAGNSGIRSFKVEPKGASFRPTDQHEFLWSILATDVDFPPSGGMYVSDWIEGWGQPTKGRIYHLTFDDADEEGTAEVARLLADGFAERSIEELIGLLGHADQRVRQRAQFALADRGEEAIEPLSGALESEDEIVRLHALWGLGQNARTRPRTLALGRLDDPSPHVRGQVAKLIGELFASAPEFPQDRRHAFADRRRQQYAVHGLIERLSDEHPRVRMFAAIALGKLGGIERFAGASNVVDGLASMIRENADEDAYLRHAGVMGLLGTATDEDLKKLAEDDSASVRLATLLVYRRQQNPEVARFLDDPEPRLVLEAARAINDAAIDSAAAKLAKLEVNPETPVPILRRVLNANLKVGGPEAAAAVARVATREGMPEGIRTEALAILADWADPSGRDRVVGLWRPVPNHEMAEASGAVQPIASELLTSGPEAVRTASAKAVASLGISEAAPALFELFADEDAGTEARVEAIRALEAIEDPRLAAVARRSTNDADPRIRTEGLRVLSGLDPNEALPVLEVVLENGSTTERQGALGILGAIESDRADAVLATWLDRMIAGDVPGEIMLDLIEAAGNRSSDEVRGWLERVDASRSAEDPLGSYRETLLGGDARRGRQIFFERTEAQCQRCHKIDGQGGDVGPVLSDIGAKHDRDYILESIVLPDSKIAEGFETLVVATVDGQILTGIVKEDSGDSLTLMDADGETIVVPQDDIEERQRGISAMPVDLLNHLSKRDIRDLVEYLARRTGEGSGRDRGHGR